MWLWFHSKNKQADEESPPVIELTSRDDDTRACPKCGNLSSILADRFSESRKYILQRIDHAQEVSNKETLSIGECVNDIVSHARDYIQKSTASLEEGFGKQSQSLEGYLDHAREVMDVQAKTVEQALALSEDIAQAGMSVSKLAREARLLALNAKIESTRLGSKGSAFGIISEEMNQMSSKIAKTNQMVSDTAAAMSACLPVITEQAIEQIHDLEQLIGVMNELKGEIEESLLSSNDAGETHIDKILGLAYSALSHLQFQDPMMQDLQKIDYVMKDLQENLCQDLEVPLGTAPSSYDERLDEKATNNDETPAPQIKRDPGDVLLF